MQVRAQANGEFALVCDRGHSLRRRRCRARDHERSGGAFAAAKIRVRSAAHSGDRRHRLPPERLTGSAVQRPNGNGRSRTLRARRRTWKPDLVIHVGDYFYRENACPADATGCQGTPFGDNWPTWAADFFNPRTSRYSPQHLGSLCAATTKIVSVPVPAGRVSSHPRRLTPRTSAPITRRRSPCRSRR